MKTATGERFHRIAAALLSFVPFHPSHSKVADVSCSDCDFDLASAIAARQQPNVPTKRKRTVATIPTAPISDAKRQSTTFRDERTGRKRTVAAVPSLNAKWSRPSTSAETFVPVSTELCCPRLSLLKAHVEALEERLSKGETTFLKSVTELQGTDVFARSVLLFELYGATSIRDAETRPLQLFSPSDSPKCSDDDHLRYHQWVRGEEGSALAAYHEILAWIRDGGELWPVLKPWLRALLEKHCFIGQGYSGALRTAANTAFAVSLLGANYVVVFQKRRDYFCSGTSETLFCTMFRRNGWTAFKKKVTFNQDRNHYGCSRHCKNSNNYLAKTRRFDIRPSMIQAIKECIKNEFCEAWKKEFAPQVMASTDAPLFPQWLREAVRKGKTKFAVQIPLSPSPFDFMLATCTVKGSVLTPEFSLPDHVQGVVQDLEREEKEDAEYSEKRRMLVKRLFEANQKVLERQISKGAPTNFKSSPLVSRPSVPKRFISRLSAPSTLVSRSSVPSHLVSRLTVSPPVSPPVSSPHVASPPVPSVSLDKVNFTIPCQIVHSNPSRAGPADSAQNPRTIGPTTIWNFSATNSLSTTLMSENPGEPFLSEFEKQSIDSSSPADFLGVD